MASTDISAAANPTISKKAARKEQIKLEKKRLQEERAAAAATVAASESDPLSSNYGDIAIEDLQSNAVTGRIWTNIESLGEDLKDKEVLIRGSVQTLMSAHLCIFPCLLNTDILIQVRSLRIDGEEQVMMVAPSSDDDSDDDDSDVIRRGSWVFRPMRMHKRALIKYHGQPACLAQSPQLHKQMSIRTSPVPTLCDFTSLDVELEIKEHYFEVIDIVDSLFVAIFDGLKERCKKELESIGKQYPFEPLKYLRKSLVLTFQEGVQMLKEAGIEVDPLGDLNTETERKLGQLVKEKYETDFYILHRYPLAVRPFYTMPCYNDPLYNNSFDVFLRGEEIISGAQRVHDPELLEKRAKERGIDVKTISTYIDSFRYGAPPHGGFGAGLERVVMLYCALNNIRKTSLFPRDPRRLAP
ncbi:aspartate--tRNA ligase [Ranunculus cassubicifolius]